MDQQYITILHLQIKQLNEQMADLHKRVSDLEMKNIQNNLDKLKEMQVERL